MTQEVPGRCCGRVSGETLHMVYDERANRFLMEPTKPSSSSPVARALVELLRLVSSSEGSLSEPESETHLMREEQSVNTVKVSKTQAQSLKNPAGSAWRLGDLLLGRPSPPPEKTSENTSKKPASSSETYVEAYDESGRSYLKKVAVEG